MRIHDLTTPALLLEPTCLEQNLERMSKVSRRLSFNAGYFEINCVALSELSVAKSCSVYLFAPTAPIQSPLAMSMRKSLIVFTNGVGCARRIDPGNPA